MITVFFTNRENCMVIIVSFMNALLTCIQVEPTVKSLALQKHLLEHCKNSTASRENIEILNNEVTSINFNNQVLPYCMISNMSMITKIYWPEEFPISIYFRPPSYNLHTRMIPISFLFTKFKVSSSLNRNDKSPTKNNIPSKCS